MLKVLFGWRPLRKWLIGLMVLCWTDVTMSVGQTTAPANLDYPWRHPNNSSFRDPGIPMPISQAELDYVKWILRLSDEQNLQLRRLHDDYLQANFDLRKEEEAPVFAMAVLRPNAPYGSRESSDDGLEMMEMSRSLVAKLDSIDAQLFDRLSAGLTVQQQDQLPRVRELRRRIVASASPCRHPGGAYDLEIQILELLRPHIDPGERFVACDPVIRAYESQATVLWEQQSHAYQEARRFTLEAIPRLSAQSPDLSPASARDIREALQRKVDTNAELEMRRYDLNVDFVSRLAPKLPADQGQLLIEMFNRKAYAPVYPNPFDCFDELRMAAQGSLVDDALRGFIQSTIDQYATSRDLLDRKMIDAYLKYMELSLRNITPSQPDREAHESEMNQLQQQRKALAQKHMYAVQSVLGPEALAELQPMIDRWRHRSEKHAARWSGIAYFP